MGAGFGLSGMWFVNMSSCVDADKKASLSCTQVRDLQQTVHENGKIEGLRKKVARTANRGGNCPSQVSQVASGGNLVADPEYKKVLNARRSGEIAGNFARKGWGCPLKNPLVAGTLLPSHQLLVRHKKEC